MDDLNGLDWSAGSNTNANKVPATGTGNYYTSIRPIPPPKSSGRSTPLSAQVSGVFKPPAGGIPKPSTPDSFSNLVSFGSAKQAGKLTLQEQQEKLQAEKLRKAAEEKKQFQTQFEHSQFWDGLGTTSHARSSTPLEPSRSSTPAINPSPSNVGFAALDVNGGNLKPSDEDDDLFAAFNADTKVDNSSHYPPPPLPTSGKSTPATKRKADLSKPEAWETSTRSSTLGDLGNDDDPFGLGEMGAPKRYPLQSLAHADDDDDFLGDLGKPVEEVKRQTKTSPVPNQPASEPAPPESDDPFDRAVSELVDMGFSVENSRRALTESGTGLDIQAAVGWLLNEAHRQAKQKAQNKGALGTALDPGDGPQPDRQSKNTSADRSHQEAIPTWMRQEGRAQSQPRREESKSPANNDSDISRTASAVGTNLLKTANSLWKTSQKKVHKAVSEFAQDSDPSQPKWMRDASTERQRPKDNQTPTVEIRRGRIQSNVPSVTDEAMMLEGNSRPILRKPKVTSDPRFTGPASASSRDQSPVTSNPSTGRSTPIPRWQQAMPSPSLDTRGRLSKQAVEEQSAQAYISPARRKKAVPPPEPTGGSDLLFGESATGSSQSPVHPEVSRSRFVEKPKASKVSQPSSPIPVRPKAPTRIIPTLSPAALATSNQHRLAGTAHFKRGDFASAHSSYTASLGSVTQDHPITIILLCNRSLTALKTGDPKGAVSDADTALKLIGPSHGESESIDLHDGTTEGKKPMQEFWGKALMRKAEALEQMERWKDAGAVWREAVEAGVGGATAVQGRQRCEKALAPKPKPAAPRQPPKAAPKIKPTVNDLVPAPAKSTAAVKRLRAANLAAEKADDEKFALSDIVDAKISKWRDGRKDNLRALLGGLDQVLWESSGWKKVGMHELVINSRVKVVYMKAIARVHPDKLPQDAMTEIKMISASVFATLNEAWDKFKAENGM